MISRIWHGWTTPGNADRYEALLREEIFTGIQDRHIRGFEGIQLLRREVGGEVEFVTIMKFDTLDAVRAFAGEIMKPPLSLKRPGWYSPITISVRSIMKFEQSGARCGKTAHSPHVNFVEDP